MQRSRIWNAVLVAACAIVASDHADAAPKTMVDHKINFGWPSFFNPEMGMMREKHKKNKKKKDQEEGEGNEVDTSTEEDHYEDLIDYTLKGGLRGTLLLLNSSSVTDVMMPEGKAGNLTEVASKIMQEEEEEEKKKKEQEEGEDEGQAGVRLRTPIVVKKRTPELGKYGAKVTFFAGAEPTKFIYYGNWCGRGGRSAPVDNLDRCCLEHEMCYGRTVRECPDVWKKPYNMMYAWTPLDEEVVCVRSESYCINHVCECDREAALCFQHYLSAPEEIATHLGTKSE
nr:uncharacterized protein LOC113821709 [Penaeus vannamei]